MTLDQQIRVFLEERGPSTVSEIASGIRRRYQDVVEAITWGAFVEAPTPIHGSSRASYWVVAPNASHPLPRPKRGTHKARVLQLLSDGRPHSHLELYALGCIAHSRVADLRRDGYDIQASRIKDGYVYQLVGSLAAPARPVSHISSLLGTRGERAGAASEPTAPRSVTGSVPVAQLGEADRADDHHSASPLTLFAYPHRGTYGDEAA